MDIDCDDEGVLQRKRMHSVADEESANVASPFSCYVNLANTILGSGMLGLPYAFSRTGWVLGSILLIICGCFSSFGLHLLALCALKDKYPSSFYTVAHSAMPKFTLLIDIAVAVKCFGVATSYLIVIGDLMPDVMDFFDVGGALAHRQLWVLIGFLIVAPLSCLRNLDSLKFTSFFAIGFVVFLTILITLYASDISDLDACEDIDAGEECKGDTSNFVGNMDTMRVFSIFVFGFTCQQVIFIFCLKCTRAERSAGRV
jgi:amino acid permease